MSVQLQELIASLIQSAPSPELANVSHNLKTISGASSSTVEDSLTRYIHSQPIAVSGYIVSQHNKDPKSSKYVDYVRGQRFNFDLRRDQVIDVETVGDLARVDAKLVSSLEQYGKDYFYDFSFTVIPSDDVGVFRVVIVGQRRNMENFYTGVWRSEYEIKDGRIEGDVSIDIHYFEDGNVRLKYSDVVNGELSNGGGGGANAVVNFINKTENQIEKKIIAEFQVLNQQSFKNLRRLLPVTRSKINWGNAIGNYRLGSDVVNRK
ncbi:uncharacterized protein LODBEIA_P09300 [Lodderomyces beijingensis]|uniref:F-actin-capping protein subunit alpha n=1 Tax=Lodderomyces beijingensis TaxID=1775926 RepID=A0ABP0ZIP7_9ASCO